MMLEIIMPHYKEDWSIVKPFFDVLNSQRGIDFSQLRVHIIHDGSSAFPGKLFKDSPYAVKQTVRKHAGVSAARNYGIDKADATWVCFCDCDDTFTDVYSLKLVFDLLGTEDADLLWGDFVMENYDVAGNLHMIIQSKMNTVWIHNKYYRLNTLRKLNIRFNEDLYMSEDSAFNTELSLYLPVSRIAKIKSDIPLYTWSYRKGSVTLDPDRLLKNMEGHFDRNLYMLGKYREVISPDTMLMAGRTLTDAYVNLTRKDLPEGYEHFEERVKEFILKESKLLNALKKDELDKVLRASENEAQSGGYLNPDRPDLRTWIRTITRCKT